jgi:hypothetical protein
MRKIKNFEEYLSAANPSDLMKVSLFAHSDRFSFSHVDHVVKAAASMLFNFITPPGIYEDSIDSSIPVYNYGNDDEIRPLIKSGAIKRKNVYNLPYNLINANDKVKFHECMSGSPFVPKTVFSESDAHKLKFPIIAKPKTGSKGQGITVFKNKEELDSYDGEKLDVFSEKFDLQREFRIISMKGQLLYLAERIPVNKKAKSLRESEDIFMRDGTLSGRSEYVWKERNFGKGGLPDAPAFEKICKTTHDKLGLDVLGIDIGIDGSGKLWLIEANTCPGLNNDQVVRIYLAIFEDFYGRKPDARSMDKIKEVQKELRARNKDKIKFSFHSRPGRMMDFGYREDGNASSSVKFDMEKSFGRPLKDIVNEEAAYDFRQIAIDVTPENYKEAMALRKRYPLFNNIGVATFLATVLVWRVVDQRELDIILKTGKITGGNYSVPAEKSFGASFGGSRGEVVDWGLRVKKAGRISGQLYVIGINAQDKKFMNINMTERLEEQGLSYKVGDMEVDSKLGDVGLGYSIHDVRLSDIHFIYELDDKTKNLTDVTDDII